MTLASTDIVKARAMLALPHAKYCTCVCLQPPVTAAMAGAKLASALANHIRARWSMLPHLSDLEIDAVT